MVDLTGDDSKTDFKQEIIDELGRQGAKPDFEQQINDELGSELDVCDRSNDREAPRNEPEN